MEFQKNRYVLLLLPTARLSGTEEQPQLKPPRAVEVMKGLLKGRNNSWETKSLAK